MKVIFLDIDGVLNCKQTPNPRKFPFIVPGVVGPPQPLARAHRRKGRVVVELALRPGRYVQRQALTGIPFIDTIPDLPNEPRCNPICDWLRHHPDVERFIVIDDEDDQLDALPLFQPSRSTGLDR